MPVAGVPESVMWYCDTGRRPCGKLERLRAMISTRGLVAERVTLVIGMEMASPAATGPAPRAVLRISTPWAGLGTVCGRKAERAAVPSLMAAAATGMTPGMLYEAGKLAVARSLLAALLPADATKVGRVPSGP